MSKEPNIYRKSANEAILDPKVREVAQRIWKENIDAGTHAGQYFRISNDEIWKAVDEVYGTPENGVFGDGRLLNDGFDLDRCVELSPMGNRCQKPAGHSGTCHANDGKHVEDWTY